MLALLLDEQISPRVAQQLRARRPDIAVTSVYEWQGGIYAGAPDRAILAAARDAVLTLVTFDRKTIPPVLRELGGSAIPHAGVIFVDQRTIASSNLGGLIRALTAFWDTQGSGEWANRIGHLSATNP